MLQEIAPFSFDLDTDDERDRADDRVNVPYPARIIVGEENEAGALTAHLVNLSDGGAALRVYGRLEPGDSARLIIDMGHAPVVISMRAVWTRMLPGGRMVGVTFSRVTPDQQAVIAKLLGDHQS